MVNDLYDDLWIIIFNHVVQTDGSSALFTICSVNTRWRDVASSTPILWRDIVVNRVAQLKSDIYIRRFICNSRTATLRIAIDLPNYESSDDGEDLETLKILRPCAERVESLRLSCRHYGVVAAFFKAMGKGQAAPVLDSVHISDTKVVREDDPFSRLEWFTTSFSPAARLRHLTLPPPPLPNGPVVDALLSSLASLSIATHAGYVVYPTEILDFIGRAALTDFHFHCNDRFTFYATDSLDYDIITTLPTLKRIDVTAPGGGTDLLRNICAPSLQEVRLDGWREKYALYRQDGSYWYDLYQVATYISATLERTSIRSPNLRSLHLEYVHLNKPDEEYSCILSGEWFPNLEELLMEVLKITDTPFIAAAPKATPLQKLVILRCKRVTAAGLRAFVAGRSRTFSLMLELPAGVDGEEFHTLSELCAVELRY